jgi:carbonic anhydrase
VPVYVITCLDPRVDPSGFLGITPSDAFVVRNVGGRVHGETARDVAVISAVAEMFVTEGPLFRGGYRPPRPVRGRVPGR